MAPNHTQQSDEDDVLAPLEEAEERSMGLLYRVRRTFAHSWRLVSAFEDRYPWFFFASASIVVFIMILALVSLFVGNREVPSSSGEEPIENEVHEEVPQQSLSTTGVLEGIDASRVLSNVRVAEELVSPISRLERDGVISESDDPVAVMLVTARDIEDLLKVDVQTYLNASTSRTNTYNEYLTELAKRERTATDLFTELTTQLHIEQQLFAQMTSDRDQSFSALNEALSTITSAPDVVEAALSEYGQNAAVVARQEVEIDILTDALRSTQPIIEQARLRLAGMIANRDALIAGITVVDIDGSGLEFFRSGALEEFYDTDTGDVISQNQSTTQVNPLGSRSNTNTGTPSVGAVPGFTIPQLRVMGLEEAYTNN